MAPVRISQDKPSRPVRMQDTSHFSKDLQKMPHIHVGRGFKSERTVPSATIRARRLFSPFVITLRSAIPHYLLLSCIGSEPPEWRRCDHTVYARTRNLSQPVEYMTLKDNVSRTRGASSFLEICHEAVVLWTLKPSQPGFFRSGLRYCVCPLAPFSRREGPRFADADCVLSNLRDWAMVHPNAHFCLRGW